MYSTRIRSFAARLWAVFFVNGAVLSSWAPRIPEVKRLLDLSDSELGIALFGVAAGAVPALLLTARILDRARSGPVCVVTALLFSAALPLIGVADHVWQLTGALMLLGAASGVLDIAMNTAGIAYQQHTGHRVLSRLHGGYSLGVLAGALGGVVATQVGATATEHFLAVAVLLVALTLVCAPMLWSQPRRPAERGAEDAPVLVRDGRFGLPVTISVLAVSGLLIEGLVTDWSALLITRDLGASASLGATTLALFSLAMFISRSAGDTVLDRFAERTVLTTVAVTVVCLVVLGSVVAHPLVMAVAVGLVGLVLGPVFPVAVSRASRSAPGRAAAMTARVSAVGYIAYLGGPPAIGFIADGIGLPVTFAAAVALSCLGIALACRGPG
ncbi:putative arabinose efflux permease, MFS family [Promicromonospora umidemergens]|uniref:MFS transporter n=1 Tax=Promicromonospora umidemergens TaxID=629679 RepID=A0ABP8X119_9MICO|nr:MFS transporter [Promicromonospora umidemergens]MCP2285704.1 putative arabinose efflux permease, MFS family [Promicromonospora umidemergens]